MTGDHANALDHNSVLLSERVKIFAIPINDPRRGQAFVIGVESEDGFIFGNPGVVGMLPGFHVRDTGHHILLVHACVDGGNQTILVCPIFYRPAFSLVLGRSA